MNSDARRLASHFNTRSSLEFQSHHYYVQEFKDRLEDPSFLITVALIVVTIAYQTAHQFRPLPSLPQLIWDALVTLVPAQLLFGLENLINPPLFPNVMQTTQPPTRAAKSDALRRILGMDNGRGILSSVSQAGRKTFGGWPVAALGRRAVVARPPGLGNYNNSCYQNSILQGLASLESLPAYLSAVSLQRRPGRSPTRTVDTLRELIADLTNPLSDGRTLWTPEILKNMSTWTQEDAQEYYSKLLDQIDTEIAKVSRAYVGSPSLEPERSDRDSSVSRASHDSDDSGYHSMTGHSRSTSEPRFARNPLEGLIAQRVACVSCGYCEGLTMIPFNCLTLTLGDLPEHDLYERLDHYTKVEPIENVECPKCTLLLCRDLVNAVAARTGMQPELQQRLQAIEEALEDELFDEQTLTKKCNIQAKMRASATKTKQVALARPPQSLVFHINRSAFNERTGYLYKNSAAVRFPMLLDLGPWCLGSKIDLKDGSVPAQDVEQWTLDPKASMVAGDRGQSRVTGPIYELRAVVTHQGHHDNGHYVCYRRHPVPNPPPRAVKGGDGQDSEIDLDSNIDEDENKSHAAGDSPASSVNEADEPPTVPNGQDEQKFQWWRLSDEDAYPVDEQTVLAQGGVFMLFYDCVDHNSVLVSEVDEAPAAEQASQDAGVAVAVSVEEATAAAPTAPSKHSRAARRATSPGIDTDKSLKNVQPPPDSIDRRPAVLAAHHTAGVTKKTKSGRKAVLSSRARRRQLKNMDRAEAIMDRTAVKVQKSIGRAKVIGARKKGWDDINREAFERAEKLKLSRKALAKLEEDAMVEAFFADEDGNVEMGGAEETTGEAREEDVGPAAVVGAQAGAAPAQAVGMEEEEIL
ncbi:hypothetical protein VTJ49DRAFT_5968 [Mycothermus thermophilus]|uniref:ubiquitinyl hydrolase 1 n=1 Tax=Humicola insolens TaxID=85995 RepID=A0ABR3V259_HUMIN